MATISATLSATRLKSTQTEGVSPVVAASTTVVANLNADLLDGLHAAAFALVAHTHAFADLTAKPTTLAGYGITDAAALSHTHDIEALTTALGTVGQVWTKGVGSAMGWEDAAGGGAVASVFGRTGAVVAVANDYSFAQLSGSISIAQHGATGTPDSTTFLRGDNVWAVPPGGGGGLASAYDALTGDTGSAAASGASGILFTGAAGITTTVATGAPDSVTITLGNHSAALLTSGTLPDARIQASGVTQHQASLSIAATQLTGNLAIARFNGGTGASSSTFWRGDGTWVAAGGSVDESANYAWTGSHTFTDPMGVGTTDLEAWHTDYVAIQIGATGVFEAHRTLSVVDILENIYRDSGGLKYKTTAAASRILLTSGQLQVLVSTSGTADTGTTEATAFRVTNAGAVQFAAIGTTGSGANAFLDSAADNNLLRVSSSLRYKDVLREMGADEARGVVLALRPIAYRSLAPADNDREFVGLGAEHVTDPRFVHYFDGKPDGVMYDRLTVPLAVLAQDHEARLRALETRSAA